MSNTYNSKEYKLVSLRECPNPADLADCDTPEKAAAYWRNHVVNHPNFNPEVECLVVLLLNTRRKVKGHLVVSVGVIDGCMVHPREVFRPAIIGSASAIVVMHNHPSGDSSPSESDIVATRNLVQAGKLLKIELLDHVIIGAAGTSTSLRSLGYFNTNV
jgi:DNA repair protein RadC